jgi:hypothetical protein
MSRRGDAALHANYTPRQLRQADPDALVDELFGPADASRRRPARPPLAPPLPPVGRG